MDQLLQTELLLLFTAIPLLGFLATLPWDNRQERVIAGIVRVTKVVYALVAVGYALAWWWTGSPDADHTLVSLFEKEGFIFSVVFRYDAMTAAFSITGALLFLVVATFSKYYMHRDEGYKRYFNTILLFAFGYNLIVLSANFETLFIGWEIIGISSFLLIAFYRKRYLPVKNAFKVLSYYRISDVMLMLSMWMMHHLTHRNILFDELGSVAAETVATHREGMASFIAAMLLVAAMVKSASFPFSHWLPRAMEGPLGQTGIDHHRSGHCPDSRSVSFCSTYGQNPDRLFIGGADRHHLYRNRHGFSYPGALAYHGQCLPQDLSTAGFSIGVELPGTSPVLSCPQEVRQSSGPRPIDVVCAGFEGMDDR
ncbi:MAG: hypothetical protein LW694_05680 [Chitinophagaceae bacterium]|nr:hypothetical protein [Chitinophagaceae bacterium]